MPELPEVHTITNDLKENIVGFTIAKAYIAERYPKINNKVEFVNKVSGKKVKDVKRIAKNILVEFEDGDYLHIHLAMTGQVFLLDPKEKTGKHAHAVFQLKKEGINKLLTFADARMFGKVGLLDKQQLKELEQKYGVEPIAADADPKTLYETLKNRKTIIKNILMDQSIIAGLGNIYATEALFLAKINPQTQMKNISREQFINLFESAKNVLKQGIENRGSTLPDKMYVDIWGRAGSQQDHFNVYLKDNCPNCGTSISYIKIGGRGTYFCPSCQPIRG